MDEVNTQATPTVGNRPYSFPLGLTKLDGGAVDYPTALLETMYKRRCLQQSQEGNDFLSVIEAQPLSPLTETLQSQQTH